MKIAIVSCINALAYRNQPVWDNIAARSPDALVLLGDSVYYDSPWMSTFGNETLHPRDIDPDEFLRNGLERYNAQLSIPSFAAVVKQVRSYAIWDDHDFLWNGAAGGSLPRVYKDHIRASRALSRVFREALARQDPSSFPQHTGAAELQIAYEPSSGYQLVRLDASTFLHLTDGRSYRGRNDLLSSAQRAQITGELHSSPQESIHLIASGSVFQVGQECWRTYSEDFEWIQEMAVTRRILILSGDIHKNQIPAPFKVPGGHDILEITSSGAAIGALVNSGKQKHNFGMVEISNGQLTLATYKDAAAAQDQGPVTYQLGAW